MEGSRFSSFRQPAADFQIDFLGSFIDKTTLYYTAIINDSGI